MIDEARLRRVLRTVLSAAMVDRLIAMAKTDDRADRAERRAERAAEGIEVDDVAARKAARALRRIGR